MVRELIVDRNPYAFVSDNNRTDFEDVVWEAYRNISTTYFSQLNPCEDTLCDMLTEVFYEYSSEYIFGDPLEYQDFDSAEEHENFIMHIEAQYHSFFYSDVMLYVDRSKLFLEEGIHIPIKEVW